MEQGSTTADADGTGLFAGGAWFDRFPNGHLGPAESGPAAFGRLSHKISRGQRQTLCNRRDEASLTGLLSSW